MRVDALHIANAFGPGVGFTFCRPLSKSRVTSNPSSLRYFPTKFAPAKQNGKRTHTSLWINVASVVIPSPDRSVMRPSYPRAGRAEEAQIEDGE